MGSSFIIPRLTEHYSFFERRGYYQINQIRRPLDSMHATTYDNTVEKMKQ